MSLSRFTFTDRVAPVVELGVGDTRIDVGIGVWDASHWDNPDATWSGADNVWLDVSCFIHEATFTYGRSRTTDRFAPGTASLVMANDSGLADIDPEDITAVTLRPGRMLRIGVDHVTFGRRWLWCGYVDSVVPSYDPDEHDVVQIDAFCALAEVGRVELLPFGAPSGASDLAAGRVSRILNRARWPSSKRVLHNTGVPMLPTTMNYGQTADGLGITADSAGGAIYGDTSGRVVFRGRDWQAWNDDDPNDGEIGNVAAGSYCPTGWHVSARREDVVTHVILGRTTDATPFEWTDQIGLSLYGPESYAATDLECKDQTQLTTLATRLFRTRGYGVQPRIESVSFNAATGLDGSSPAADVMSTLDVFKPSRYRCRLELPRGSIFDAEMFATGVRHHMTPDEWTLDADLDRAEPYHAIGDRWDGAYWDSALWAETV